MKKIDLVEDLVTSLTYRSKNTKLSPILIKPVLKKLDKNDYDKFYSYLIQEEVITGVRGNLNSELSRNNVSDILQNYFDSEVRADLGIDENDNVIEDTKDESSSEVNSSTETIEQESEPTSEDIDEMEGLFGFDLPTTNNGDTSNIEIESETKVDEITQTPDTEIAETIDEEDSIIGSVLEEESLNTSDEKVSDERIDSTIDIKEEEEKEEEEEIESSILSGELTDEILTDEIVNTTDSIVETDNISSEEQEDLVDEIEESEILDSSIIDSKVENNSSIQEDSEILNNETEETTKTQTLEEDNIEDETKVIEDETKVIEPDIKEETSSLESETKVDIDNIEENNDEEEVEELPKLSDDLEENTSYEVDMEEDDSDLIDDDKVTDDSEEIDYNSLLEGVSLDLENEEKDSEDKDSIIEQNIEDNQEGEKEETVDLESTINSYSEQYDESEITPLEEDLNYSEDSNIDSIDQEANLEDISINKNLQEEKVNEDDSVIENERDPNKIYLNDNSSVEGLAELTEDLQYTEESYGRTISGEDSIEETQEVIGSKKSTFEEEKTYNEETSEQDMGLDLGGIRVEDSTEEDTEEQVIEEIEKPKGLNLNISKEKRIEHREEPIVVQEEKRNFVFGEAPREQIQIDNSLEVTDPLLVEKTDTTPGIYNELEDLENLPQVNNAGNKTGKAKRKGPGVITKLKIFISELSNEEKILGVAVLVVAIFLGIIIL